MASNTNVEEIKIVVSETGVQSTEKKVKKLSRAQKKMMKASEESANSLEKLSKKQRKALRTMGAEAEKMAKSIIQANDKVGKSNDSIAKGLGSMKTNTHKLRTEYNPYTQKMETPKQVEKYMKFMERKKEQQRKALEKQRAEANRLLAEHKQKQRELSSSISNSFIDKSVRGGKSPASEDIIEKVVGNTKQKNSSIDFWKKMKESVSKYSKELSDVNKKIKSLSKDYNIFQKKLTTDGVKEEDKRKKKHVFPYWNKRISPTAMIMRIGGAIGIGMMIAGAVQRAIASTGRAMSAVGDAQNNKMRTDAFVRGYRNNDFNQASSEYSRMSGLNKYGSRDVMANALGQLQGNNIRLRNGGAVDLAKVIRGLQQYNGLDQEHATNSAIGLLSGTTSLSTMNMSKVRKSDDPNVTLKNILKFLEKNTNDFTGKKSINDMITGIKSAPSGLLASMMQLHEDQFNDMAEKIYDFVSKVFNPDDPKVQKAWGGVVTALQEDVNTLFGQDQGEGSFAENLAFLFASFADGITLFTLEMEIFYMKIQKFFGWLDKHPVAKFASESLLAIAGFGLAVRTLLGLLEPIHSFGKMIKWAIGVVRPDIAEKIEQKGVGGVAKYVAKKTANTGKNVVKKAVPKAFKTTMKAGSKAFKFAKFFSGPLGVLLASAFESTELGDDSLDGKYNYDNLSDSLGISGIGTTNQTINIQNLNNYGNTGPLDPNNIKDSIHNSGNRH